MSKDTENAGVPRPGYETRDVNARAIYAFGITLALVLVATILVARGMFGYFSKTQPLGPPPTPFYTGRVLPPEPRLQPEPKLDLRTMLDEQQKLLSSYGWSDQATGKVRIPIDRAMDLVLQRGLPVRPQTKANALENATQPAAGASGEPSATKKRRE